MLDEAILLRIKKVKNLQKSNNPNEAANAAALMQELLIKYNVTIEDVDQTQFRKGEEYIKEYQAIVAPGRHNKATWMVDLAQSIATNNLCTLLQQGQSIIWIGKPSNIEVCKFMLGSISFDLERMCEANWNALDFLRKEGKILYLPHGKTWKASFFAGAVSEINKRLQENKQQLEQDNNTKALIVRTDQELTEAVKILIGKVRSVSTSRRIDAQGYNAGREAGRSVAFRQGVGAGSPTRQIKGG